MAATFHDRRFSESFADDLPIRRASIPDHDGVAVTYQGFVIGLSDLLMRMLCA